MGLDYTRKEQKILLDAWDTLLETCRDIESSCVCLRGLQDALRMELAGSGMPRDLPGARFYILREVVDEDDKLVSTYTGWRYSLIIAKLMGMRIREGDIGKRAFAEWKQRFGIPAIVAGSEAYARFSESLRKGASS